MKLLLGIDIGTGSAKGVVVDPVGTIVAAGQSPLTMRMPRPSWAEMDAEQDWWGSVVTLCEQILPKVAAIPGAELVGMCVSGLGPALVVCDDAMRPLAPAMLYGIDSRAEDEIVAQTRELGEDQILQRSGKLLSSQAIGPKLAWVRRHVEGYEPRMRWFSTHTYVVQRLTDRWVMDHHTASQCDPLYDVCHQEWATDWVERLLPGLALPELVWPADIVGHVTHQAASATGLPEGLPVAAGTVDAWAEAFSVGVRRPGDLMLMYGSTMFLIQVLPAPTMDARLWTTSGVAPDSHTLAAGMSTSGSLTTWMRELMGSPDFDTLVAEAAQVPAGSDGLVVLPYFAGERTPHYDPDARGVIAGLSLRHTRGHLFRAAYEGIAYGLGDILDILAEVAGPAARVVAVGGGTQSQLWIQIVSDVCGIEQVIPDVTVGASFGDALLAAIGVGAVPAGTTWATSTQQVVPDQELHVHYARMRRLFRETYPATRPVVHALSQIQGEPS